MTFSSTELNILIWRYLQESGFTHTAYTFSVESHLEEAQVDTRQIISGALTTLIQKGLYYTEAELCSTVSDDTDKTAIDNLSLIEAVLTEPPLHKVRLREPRCQGSTDQMTDKEQKERDREMRGLHNGKLEEVDGYDGFHGKKHHAAHQASTLNGQRSNGVQPKDEYMAEFKEEQVRFLKCHSSEVFLCAWNPKNDLMASGSGDATVRIWELDASNDSSLVDGFFESRTKVLRHSSPNSEEKDPMPKNKDVTSLDWNSGGDYLATGCYDGYARVWTASGNLKCVLGNHKGPIFALKWNQRGDYILSAGVDKTTVVWDAFKDLANPVQQFAFHEQSALDVEWITNEIFVSCSTDKSIYKCRIGHDKPLLSFKGHENEVNAIRYDRHSNRLASCSDDMTLRIWNVDEDEAIHSWEAHKKEIYTIRWSPIGFLLASASFDHTVRIWDVQRGECVRTLSRHKDPVYSVSFSPDGRYLATGCFDRTVYIWDVHSGRHLQSYVGEKSEGGIFDVNWNSRGDKVAAAASDGTVILIDVRHIRNRLV